MEVDLARLGRFIADNFDLHQLQALCQELDVDGAQLWGETRSAKAFDLVSIMEERGQVSLLVAAVAQARPHQFDPQEVQVRSAPEPASRSEVTPALLVGAGFLLTLVVLLLLWLRPLSPPAVSPATRALASSTPTRLLPAVATPSPLAVTLPTATSSATPVSTPTSEPSAATPTRIDVTPSGTPSATATASATAAPSPTLYATATPTLSPLSPALVYDAGTQTLSLAPGDAALLRSRLCTPLNAYQREDVLYMIDSVADRLALPLPGQAQVTHLYPADGEAESMTRVLEVQRHPVSGVKVSGEPADFTGCDLVLAQSLREQFGLPLELGEFDDPARFDHGWVIIQFQ